MRWAAVVLALALAGCVERIITVRSQPAGATVYVDGDKAGETPCDVKYAWYGTRKVTIEKAGYASVSRDVELRAPWYQIFPLDFITDVLIPITITDRTELHFLLQEEKEGAADPEDVKKRAAELREKAREK